MKKIELAPDWWNYGKHPITGWGNRNRFQNRKKREEGFLTNWKSDIHPKFR